MSREFSRYGEGGVTIMELLVSGMLGAIFLLGVFATTVDTKRFVFRDSSRMRTNQNLRSVLEYVGREVVTAGLRLGGAFPALELVDGSTTTGYDTLTLRKRLISEALTLCLPASGSSATLVVATADGDVDPTGAVSLEQTCLYGATGADVRFSGFRNWRQQNSQNALVYLYDPVQRQGIFLRYLSDDDTGSTRTISVAGSAGTDLSLFPTRSILLILEEAIYRVNPTSRELEVAMNQPFGDVLPVGKSVSSFNVSVWDDMDQAQATWDRMAQWGDVRSVEVRLQVAPDGKGLLKAADRTLAGRFVPRNLLSF